MPEVGAFTHPYGSQSVPFKQKADGTLVTEDTGSQTNPLRYELQHAFSSQVAVSPDALPHVLYGTGTTPARVATGSVWVYEILTYNHSCSLGSVWLETSTGVERSVKIAIACQDTVIVSLGKPIVFGANDVYYQASQANIDVQVTGLEASGV